MTLSIILIALATFFLMECVAWLMHKYVMHGFLWYFHEDHHTPHHEGVFEKNDFFFLIFAIPSMILIYLGHNPKLYYLLAIGYGITLYGFAYFTVHDIFIHQRFKFLKRTNIPYLRAIRKAHKVHHKKMTKEDGECFGMLWVPMKYFREAMRSRRS